MSPPKISDKQIRSNLRSAFAPFEEYIQLLARGKLDGYMDSLQRKDKLPVPGMFLSSDIHLLIHDIGKPDRVDEGRVKALFSKRTVFVDFLSLILKD